MMPKAILFSKPCPACSLAKRKYIPTIRQNYHLVEKDVRNAEAQVKAWGRVTNHVPVVNVLNGETSEFYIGVGGVKKLAEKCEEGNHPRPKRLTVEVK